MRRILLNKNRKIIIRIIYKLTFTNVFRYNLRNIKNIKNKY